jgi:outer membrane protein assembly factor BamB
VYSLNSTDGLISWEYENDGKIWSSPVVAQNEGILYVGSLDSHIYGLEIKTGRLNWKFPTMNAIESSPCIVDDMLFIGSKDGLLYCFSSQKRSIS